MGKAQSSLLLCGAGHLSGLFSPLFSFLPFSLPFLNGFTSTTSLGCGNAPVLHIISNLCQVTELLQTVGSAVQQNLVGNSLSRIAIGDVLVILPGCIWHFLINTYCSI